MFPPVVQPVPKPKPNPINHFHFSDLSLAYQVRERCYYLLEKYDENKDLLFDEKEIQSALIDLLKENQYELAYVTRNVFRYDVDGDRNVTYDEMVNFSFILDQLLRITAFRINGHPKNAQEKFILKRERQNNESVVICHNPQIRPLIHRDYSLIINTKTFVQGDRFRS